MNTKNPKVIVMLAVVITLLVASGCSPFRAPARIGELQTRSTTIPLDGARPERVEIDMAAGELNVSGGASELMQAKFNYNVAELNPKVTYSKGKLTVDTPDARADLASFWNLDDYRYQWDVHLNEEVPMELRVNVGIGSANLVLGGLDLTRLDLEAGAAPMTVDLTGTWQHDLDAKIDGGVGRFTLRLPSSACVRVDIDGGIGNIGAQGLAWDGDYYVNAACGNSAATLSININPGVGGADLIEAD